VADLNGVLQHILTIGGTIAQAAQELNQLVVDAVLIGLEHGVVASFADLVVHFFAGLLHHFLDAGGVDAAVHDQLLHGDAGDLTADGVKGGHDDGFGGIVDDEVDAGGGLQGADVAALAADNAALHVVVGQGDNGYGGFGHVIGGALLDGQGNDIAGFLFALFLGLGLDVADHGGGVVEGILLHALNDDLLGLVLGHGGDALQFSGLLGDHRLGFFLHLLDLGLLFVEAFLAGFHVVGLLVQGFFTLDQSAFVALHFVAALTHFALVLGLFAVAFSLGLKDFFLGLQHLFLFVLIRLADGIVVEVLGVFFRAADFLFSDVLAVCPTDNKADDSTRQSDQNPYDR